MQASAPCAAHHTRKLRLRAALYQVGTPPYSSYLSSIHSVNFCPLRRCQVRHTHPFSFSPSQHRDACNALVSTAISGRVYADTNFRLASGPENTRLYLPRDRGEERNQIHRIRGSMKKGDGDMRDYQNLYKWTHLSLCGPGAP